MSRVYVGRHVHLGRRAAVKLLSPSLVTDSQSVSRFFHEARAAAEAQSPYVVEIFDFIWEPKARIAAYVMELLRGRDLRATLQAERRLRAERAVSIAIQVCRALRVLHSTGVVHRDIKPENIFLCEGEEQRVKLIDLGIAKFGGANVAHRTMMGAPVGSPWYMSPEQAAARPLDGRADLYALGIVLHEMVSGRVPFYSEKPSEIPRMHIEAPLPRLEGPLGSVIARCLAKRPEDRFANAYDLERALARSISVEPPGLRAVA
jgi:serine/threonine-protein kinase